MTRCPHCDGRGLVHELTMGRGALGRCATCAGLGVEDPLGVALSGLTGGAALRPGLHRARRHLLLSARALRLGACWLRALAASSPLDLRELERAKRKEYRAAFARRLAREIRVLEKA